MVNVPIRSYPYIVSARGHSDGVFRKPAAGFLKPFQPDWGDRSAAFCEAKNNDMLWNARDELTRLTRHT